MSGCRLYIISPPHIELKSFAETLEETLSAGDVASFQLRLKSRDDKTISDDTILRACDTLIPITQKYNVAFLLNDRPDLVQRSQADGCHIGQSDMNCKDARKLLGADKIIGVTCHDSRHLAMVAGEDGADYVAFGAFFNTQTKQASSKAEPDILSWWQEVTTLPCVAIGGINTQNASCLIAAGADFLAVSQGIWGHMKGSTEAVVEFNKLFNDTNS